MDLKALHSMMSRKNFHYFEGQTNNDNNLYLSFSTGYNGRGNFVDIRIGDIDTDYITVNQLAHEYLNEEIAEGTSNNIIVDSELFKSIENKRG
jgi:hypothetical protein